MKTTPTIDFFAPLVGDTHLVELLETREATLKHLLPLVEEDERFHLDPADRFTYIIMGLAILIAIVVPLLNLS